MSTNMLLRKNEIVKMLQLMNQFEVELIEVQYNEGGGIGYTMDVIIPTVVNDIDGEFKVEITGAETW